MLSALPSLKIYTDEWMVCFLMARLGKCRRRKTVFVLPLLPVYEIPVPMLLFSYSQAVITVLLRLIFNRPSYTKNMTIFFYHRK